MKRVLLIFALILSLSLSFALTACGDDDTNSSNGGSGSSSGDGSGSGSGDAPSHTHAAGDPAIEHKIEATCKDEGSYQEAVYCTGCSEELSRETKIIPKSNVHTYVDGKCSVCDAPKPSEGLQFVSNGNGTCYLSGLGECSDKNVVIPESSPEGWRVIAIGKKACINAYYAESVVIPSSVERICEEAFSYAKLVSVTIPEGVKYIDSYAFYGCSWLESVTLPASIEALGDSVFENCRWLESVTLSEGFDGLGLYTFKNCTSLKTINLPDSLTSLGNLAFRDSGLTYTTLDGCKYLGNEANPYRWLVGVVDSSQNTFTISPDTKFIGESAFYGTKLTSIELPEGLIGIDSGAFSGLLGLKEIILPEGLKSIGKSAFNGCTYLVSITLPDSLEYIGYRAFYNCSALTDFTFGTGLRTIDIEAFNGCKALTTVSLPAGLEILSDAAFCNCTALTTVSIPDSLTYYGYSVFGSCTNLQYTALKGAYYLGNSENRYVILVKTTNTATTMGEVAETTKFIADGAFYDCRYLESVVLPEGLLGIGNSAFMNCVVLKNVTLPETLTYIGSQAFHTCKALTEIAIPDAVTFVGERAFYKCTALSVVTIGAGVSAMDGYLFGECSALTSFTFYDTDCWYTTFEYSDGEIKMNGSLRNVTNPEENASKLVGSFKGLMWYKLS